MGISSWQICWLSLRYLEQKIVKDICSCGLLKGRRNVEKIEEAQDIVFDVHSRGIVAERKISTQGPCKNQRVEGLRELGISLTVD